MHPPGDAPSLIFGWNAFWVALAIFALSYLLIIAERINRSIVALLGAGAAIVTGLLSQEEAIRGIDFNTIALLTGMMVLVSIARRSGMFECLALWAARRGRGNPAAMLAMLSVVTAVVSAFLDNVTTVLLIAPVTLAIARRLEAPPYPFLFAESFASNVGGTATLIGDPPNIMIGSAAGLSFNDFVLNLTPVIILVLIVQVAALHLLWGRGLKSDPDARARIMAVDPRSAILDRPLLRASLAILALTVAAFVFARELRLQPGTIALLGAALLMLCHNIEHHREMERQTKKVSETFGEVDWITIFFFIGLFVIVHGLDVAGIPAYAARHLIAATGDRLGTTATAILWGSALLSAIVDNIPYVAATIPLIKEMTPHLGGAAAATPLWWALSLGACLGGNGTLIGASANLAVAGIAERNGIEFSFMKYLKTGFALMLVTVALCDLYLRLRYL